MSNLKRILVDFLESTSSMFFYDITPPPSCRWRVFGIRLLSSLSQNETTFKKY